MTLENDFHFSESRLLALRLEAFNVFNHTQFYGPSSVDGQIEDPAFAKIESASSAEVGADRGQVSF